jgi:hypothetical protein
MNLSTAFSTMVVGAVAGLLLVGCETRTQHYGKYYQQFTPSIDARTDPWLLPAREGGARVANVADPTEGMRAMYEDGYVMIGASSFLDGPNTPDIFALRQANIVGADLVVVSKRYDSSRLRTALIPTYTPGPSVTVGTATKYGNTWYYSDFTVDSPGAVGLMALPYTEHLWNYTATYWCRPVGVIGGLLMEDLSVGSRIEAQTNRGAWVFAVVKGSPAYYADVLPRDIIRSFNGERIENNADAMRFIRANAGKVVTAQITRIKVDGDKKDRIEVEAKIKLNEVPNPRPVSAILEQTSKTSDDRSGIANDTP